MAPLKKKTTYSQLAEKAAFLFPPFCLFYSTKEEKDCSCAARKTVSVFPQKLHDKLWGLFQEDGNRAVLLENWSRPSTGVEETGRHVWSICCVQDTQGLLLEEFLFRTVTSHFHPSEADLSDAHGPAFWSGCSGTVLRVLNAPGPPRAACPGLSSAPLQPGELEQVVLLRHTSTLAFVKYLFLGEF